MIAILGWTAAIMAWLLMGYLGFKYGWKKAFIEFYKEDIWKACACSWLGLFIFPIFALLNWGLDRK